MSLNCPQAVSKLKAYKKQHQDLKQQFSDFMTQVPYLPDVKWDEPFMSSPYYKKITEAPKNIFDNLYDAKEEARKKLEELKDEVGYQEPLTEKEFFQLTWNEKYDYLSFRCHNTKYDHNRGLHYKKPTPDLRKHELEFLYDNYKNRQLVEIITHRDKNADMLRIFDCESSQIINNQQELQQAIKNKKEIKVYVGELFPNFFQVLPQNVEYIYTEFPEGRIKKMEITIGGQSKGDLIKEKKNQFSISDGAKSMLRCPDFKVSKEKENLVLIRLKVQDLGFPRGSTIEEIFAKAKKLGLELCPAETGPQLRKQYLDQPLNECLRIAMKPIADFDGSPKVFDVENDYNKLQLSSDWAASYAMCLSGLQLVFRLPKSET